MDDILLSGGDVIGIEKLQQSLCSSFHMKDLCPMIYFLRLSLTTLAEIMLTTTKSTKELIDMAQSTDSKAMHITWK